MVPSSEGMRLRPMTIGDVIDETIKIYRRHFLTFACAMAVEAVAQALMMVVIGLMTADLGQNRTPSMGSIGTFIGLSFLAVVLYLLAALVSTGAVVWIASEAILGRSTEVSHALRIGLGRSGSYFWASLLVGLACLFVGVTILGIPFAIYLGVGWSLFPQTVMIDRLRGRAALSRSSQLVSGYRWRVLGTAILLSILSFILVSIPAALVQAVTGVFEIASSGAGGRAARFAVQLVNALAPAVGQALFGSIGLITMTVLYYELRVRKEAFDLEQRAGAIQGRPSSPALGC